MAGRPAAHTLIVSEGRLPRLQGFARTKEGGEPRPLGGGSLSVFFLGRKGRRCFSFFGREGALPLLFYFFRKEKSGCVFDPPCARALRTRAQGGRGKPPRGSGPLSVYPIYARTRRVTPHALAMARQASIFSSPMTSTTENQVSMPFSAHNLANSCKPANAASPKAGLHRAA